MKTKIISALALLSLNAFGALPLGQLPPAIQLEGSLGGKVDGTAWSSGELQGKVHVLFYVAPSEKDLNKEATDKLKAEQFPLDKYASVAVVNMAASNIPNFLLNMKITQSQKEFPNTLYVKDVQGTLTKQWNLLDKSNDVVVFDKTGKVIYSFDGKLSESDIAELVSTVKSNL